MLTNKAGVLSQLHRRSRRWRTSCARAPRRCASTKCSWPVPAMTRHTAAVHRRGRHGAQAPAAAQKAADGGPGAALKPAHGLMIEDLLDVTRIRQAGGLALQLGPAHMQTLVQRTLDEQPPATPNAAFSRHPEGDLAGTLDTQRLCRGHQPGRQLTARWQRRPAGAHLRRWQPSRDREHHGFERWHHPARTMPQSG